MNAVRFRRFAALVLVLSAATYGPLVADASAQTRRAFRVTSLGIADPGIFHPDLGFCQNPLNTALALVIGPLLTTCTPVTAGVTNPCNFDFNIVAVFDPLVQTAGANGQLVPCMDGGMPCELDFAVIDQCTRNSTMLGDITCNGEADVAAPTTYSNGNNMTTCLAPSAGTFGVNNTGDPNAIDVTGSGANNCAVTGLLELTLNLGDGIITIPLKGAQLAARYNANPATGLLTGLARGFLSEADADALQIDIVAPPPLNLTIDGPLSSLLAGGATNCKTHADQRPTPGIPQDDRDYNPPGDVNGERGWWFHLTFAASIVNVPEFPTPTATFTIGQDDTPTPTPQPTNTAASTATVTNTPVPTDTPPLPTFTASATNTPASTSTPTNTPVVGQACPCDCSGNGKVEINEVVRCANIYLETQALALCPSGDRNSDLKVSISELVVGAQRYQFDDCSTFGMP